METIVVVDDGVTLTSMPNKEQRRHRTVHVQMTQWRINTLITSFRCLLSEAGWSFVVRPVTDRLTIAHTVGPTPTCVTGLTL